MQPASRNIRHDLCIRPDFSRIPNFSGFFSRSVIRFITYSFGIIKTKFRKNPLRNERGVAGQIFIYGQTFTGTDAGDLYYNNNIFWSQLCISFIHDLIKKSTAFIMSTFVSYLLHQNFGKHGSCGQV